jgi:hypothetical protein
MTHSGYLRIDLPTAVISGIAREAECRVEPDGRERFYHHVTETFWDSPGRFPGSRRR